MSLPATAPFGTVGTAMVTPFTPDGSAVDLEAAARVAEHLVDNGHDLVVVNGTTGESPTTSDEEKLATVRAVVEAIGGRARIVAGVGTNDTRHSIDLARAHAGLGIDGLLVVTPYYSKPGQAGVIAHTTAVADATDLPLMLYDIPGRSGMPLTADTLQRLAEHPRIVAVKDAKADLAEATAVMAATGLAYYSGEDALNLPWLAIGACGVVSVVGHVTGRLHRRLIDAVAAGDLDTARDLHRRLAPVVDAIMAHAPGAVVAKHALVQRGVLSHAAVRLPLVPAERDVLERLERALAAEADIDPTHPTEGTR
ncbi:4-hydroxy-tetrahydrodipicolinate synthase [Brachybacterium sp. EF45031]|uniref:4-hydroxy-tetrahydrodipicolinate synthase n=1 Tax=Brachybacterium sillae TaxID=2810536 RepID=UPI00217DD172|nr:4-hydroxy-tetrahydrodipicolinate synthase [Brachybacterium sillae]MCS6712364.1 4-hydroxy-tetrahydrodipicolinate synthase [Brachybacterium sillae]